MGRGSVPGPSQAFLHRSTHASMVRRARATSSRIAPGASGHHGSVVLLELNDITLQVYIEYRNFHPRVNIQILHVLVERIDIPPIL